jgi:hypothetical protein
MWVDAAYEVWLLDRIKPKKDEAESAPLPRREPAAA